MEIKKISLFILFSQIIFLLLNYFFSYVLNLPFLNVIPYLIVSILIFFPKVNIERLINKIKPISILLFALFLYESELNNINIILIYKYIIFFNQIIGFLLIYEVLINYFKNNFLDIIINCGLILLIIQSIGISYSSGIIKYQIFTNNEISIISLLSFSKFFPSYEKKLNLFDYIKSLTALFLMKVVGARIALLIGLSSFLTAHIIKFLKINFQKKYIKIFRFKGMKLFSILLIYSLIPYYIFLNILSNRILSSIPNIETHYEYIYRLEDCKYAKDNLKDKYIYMDICRFYENKSIIFKDSSILIRLLSDYKIFEKLKKNPINLIFPFTKNEIYLKNETGLSLDLDSRNYLDRSHNLLLSLIDNYGIIFCLLLLNIIISYEKILLKKGIGMNYNSYFILILLFFSSNQFHIIIPFLIYEKLNYEKS